MNDALINMTRALAHTGQRRLLVLEGDDAWGDAQLAWLTARLPGDWLWVSERPQGELHCTPGAVRTLLGREFTHAVFDARDGFAADALAALSGTLRAGSWLVLLTPPWRGWPARPDGDSRRWSDREQAIPTPHFVHHVMTCIQQDNDVLHWRQGAPFPALHPPDAPAWSMANGQPDRQQEAVLNALMRLEHGVAVVTAPRGRGKSALAGMLARQWPGEVWVTAPAKVATDVLAQHAGERFQFTAPDALAAALTRGTQPTGDWLIVDEAAAIPGPLLRKLLCGFPRVLMVTTVQGYEGTGRGFMLKFCASLPDIHTYRLDCPIRWAPGDPLERIIAALLLFDDDDFSVRPVGDCQIAALTQEAWRTHPAQIGALYRLLSGAHYRTSPLDLRRMMDAPGQHVAQALAGARPAGALWLVEEGGLPPALSQAVWAGFRRPRGNLVAQSLAAHGGSPEAATLRGLRISRIAVHPARQRERIGARLVAWAQREAARHHDYLSVSFGYTPELWRFWERCRFTLVRIGSHREASSGCYTAMALLPLSAAGERLTEQEHQRLRRDAVWLQPWIAIPLPVTPLDQATLNEADWRELAGFAFAHRPVEACTGSLNRLLQACTLPLPTLRAWFDGQQHATEGRKALLKRLRQETATALCTLDAARSDALQKQVAELQFI
ncbi:tRNA(Met) cytidine acetyltransferase TmcA [Siccibacter turicensis]|uniref:tRNA(Met) cytidine acetyltransferase TmcA n=1 Tax=Siccibacter turicensis TaxID=357233 RepID=A0A2P8VJ01_9ENTR|nr:GNAT family N-acetyltransferase [Siccibacter turicensis]PSN07529.1 tRNA cytosine(34) acetyltransferase TmcA [Siccibacter turicensis]